MVEVADESIGRCGAKSQRVTPKVPLEDDDTERHHDDPDEREGRLSSGEAGIEKGDSGNHEQNHACRDEDEGLITGLIPLV